MTDELQFLGGGICVVKGCEKIIRSKYAMYCKMHYHRLYRTGSLEILEKNIIPIVEHHGPGYLLAYAPAHPLSKNGRPRIYEHRIVMYDNLGAGPFSCHWCPKIVTWDTLHVDHLDNNYSNNSPSNLVPSCPSCNMKRGDPDKSKCRLASANMIEFKDVVLSQNQWAQRIGISHAALSYRLKRWPLDLALTTPRGKVGPVSK